MNYFSSDNIKVFPTAYRQYKDNSNVTRVVDVASRLNTEHNITNLVNGLLDQDINQGNFVVSREATQNNGYKIEFCMQGYYFIINETTEKPLWVKIRLNDGGYGDELFPVDTSVQTRDLDTSTDFIGLEYITSGTTTGYFQLLDSEGEVPAQSWMRFSTKNIGYNDGTTWKSIQDSFETNTLKVNTSLNISSGTLTSNHITDSSSGLEIDGVNDNGEENYSVVVNGDGEIVSSDLSATKSVTNYGQTAGTFEVIDSVSTDTQGKLSSVHTKTLPIDTSDLTNDDYHIPTSKLVKTKLNLKVDKSSFSYDDNTGELSITIN